ncbi:ABC transporter substrate-binding protein [Gordonia pseudamarae]|jgi:branched-chain amino acid transport system substrate-binding protein|uniref:ABC transporter substrate-binding protein n=1 Tax=Gordonia pseudamarae TaxID=2831662 RepID=A0ABX6IFK5_9ACTN|nr:ABC transporter substrate-binding protein [Gordonia pseudamarae]QHN34045.1 ABC transporter substrate-binding protein [Gordonia pseudamarae]
MTRSVRRWQALPAAAVALTMVMAGCSDADDDSSGDTAADLSLLGEVNAATGAPIEIAFPTTGASAAAYTHETEVANATVKYINEYLGGINGHPITLTVCEDALQAAKARECANKAVGSKDVAVVGGTPSSPDTTAAVTSPAGLAFFTTNGGSDKSMTLPNTYVLSNTPGGLVGLPAAMTKEAGAKKAALITIDAPIATGSIKALGPLAFGNAGVEMDLVAVPPGTADMTPQIQAALDGGAGFFQVLGDESFCVAAFRAMRTLGADQPVLTVNNCATTKVAEQVPGGLEGIKVQIGDDLSPDAADTKLFKAVLSKYGAEGKEDGASAFRSLVAFQRALSGMQGDVTRKSIIDRLNAQPEPAEIPISAGLKFQCGSKPVVVAPNICTGGVLVGTAGKDGTFSDIKPYEVAELLTPPSQ